VKTLAVVTGIGARTPLGLDAVSSAFLYRTGHPAMTEAALLDENEEPVTMCLHTTIDPLLVGAPRALALALPAFEEAARGLPRELKVKLVVCVDEHAATPAADGVVQAGAVVAELKRRAQEIFEDVTIETSARGAAGPAFAMSDALDTLGSRGTDAVIIGGVHTDYDPRRVLELSRAGRIFTPDNLDSMIPGELAAFVVLMRPEAARSRGLDALARIHAVGTAFEKARPDNDESAFEAIGLTVAVRKATADLLSENGRAGWLLNDLTYETFRLYEWQAMTVRMQRAWCEPQQNESPAQRIGHMGPAAIPMHVVLACEAWRRGWAPHPVALSCAGSDAGERAAVLLSATA
jgi:3-oxoacyl-[acyl-carrier-protein] synthase-1